jgi:esterase
MELFFRTVGEQGQPVIILHGLFGSSDNWLTVSKSIAEDHKVYLVDQRNHGRSPHDPVFTYEAMVEDLKHFIEGNNIENPIIIGHSMGGKTAMGFAVKYPSMLDKLVVVDIAPKYYKIRHHKLIESMATLDLVNVKSRNEAEAHLSTGIPDFGERQFIMKNLYRDEENNFRWRANLEVIKKDVDLIGADPTEGKTYTGATLFLNS